MYVIYWRQVMHYVYQNMIINFPEDILFEISPVTEVFK